MAIKMVSTKVYWNRLALGVVAWLISASRKSALIHIDGGKTPFCRRDPISFAKTRFISRISAAIDASWAIRLPYLHVCNSICGIFVT